jgi:ABC-type Fe3+ transport system substrate-binding protein
MKKIFRKTIAFFFLILAVFFCQGKIFQDAFIATLGAAELKDKGESEGNVVLYSTMGTEHSKAFAGVFMQLYPKIKVQFYSAASSPLAERILTEARGGRHLWDVLITTPFYTELFIKRGLIGAYDSPERKYYREGYKDSKGLWTSIYTNYSVFGYNTRLLNSARMPKSHADLLKPEWRGQIGMDNRPYEWVGTFVREVGEEKGLAFMRALAKQQPHLRTGRSLIGQLVAAGEVQGSLTGFSQNFENLKASGAPVDWVALDPVVAYLHPLALSSKAANPNAGRLLIDFFLSKQGQELMRSLRRIPDRVDTPPSPRRLVDGIRPVFASAELLENLDPYIKFFDQTFLGR